jgi:LysM repeat protein
VYLLWSTCVFAFLAVISSLLTDGGGQGDSGADGGTVIITTSSGPTTTTGPLRTYVVQPGESLFGIAMKFNLSAPALVEINRIKNPDRVPAGTELKLPPSNGFVPIGATTTMPP